MYFIEQNVGGQIIRNKLEDLKMRHLDIIKPSINRIKEICEEAIDHQCSWWDFKVQIEEMMKKEEKIVKMLSGVRENKTHFTKPICSKCKGSEFVYWYELEEYHGPAIETGIDDTRYSCDICNINKNNH